MRTKIQTTSLVVMLLLILSCSKEDTNNSVGNANHSGAVSASVSSNAFEQSMDEQVDQSVVGKWVIYYDWYCIGAPSSAILTVNSDGTWSADEGSTGLWMTGRRIFTFIIDGSETTYSGIMFISQIKGIMSTFDNAPSSQGCFHMAPYKDDIKTVHKTRTRDLNGKKK